MRTCMWTTASIELIVGEEGRGWVELVDRGVKVT